MRGNRSLSSIVLFALLALMTPLRAQDPDPVESRNIQQIQPVEPIEPIDGISNDRIMGVIPNFATVSDPNQKMPPLTARQKVSLAVKETVDPFTFASAAMGAGLSQFSNGTPSYGWGMASYSERVGAAFADMATQNFFADAFLAVVLHEDPRYYRMGPAHSIAKRVLYSVSRTFITRRDNGKDRFNFSGIGGMAMGIALSNAYYPDRSVTGPVTAGRFNSSLTSTALGNLLPEFWPDFKEVLAHWRHKP
jgi:hypothetical protein